MVVQRRALVMGFATIAALTVAMLYFWRFGSTLALGPFLLGGVLVAIAGVHGRAWLEARVPLLTADMTGVMVRLGGGWVALPWSDVELVAVATPTRLRDGRVVVQARDERRALATVGARGRTAALLNRWLYDASVVVPFGLTTRASVGDIQGTLVRLADGRVPVLAGDEAGEPASAVEVSGSTSVASTPPAAPTTPAAAASPPLLPLPAHGTAPTARPERTAELSTVSGAGATAAGSGGPRMTRRRLSALVAALRPAGSHTSTATLAVDVPAERPDGLLGTAPLAASMNPAGSAGSAVPTVSAVPAVPAVPATVGALALSSPATPDAEPLPELLELRRRPPEEAPPARPSAPAYDGLRSANVELVIDATTDLSAGALQGIRQRAGASAGAPAADAGAGRTPVAVAAVPIAASLGLAYAPPRAPEAVAIGGRIRDARERLDVSVDELAERTRIRPYVIESLEIGDFSPCGGDFYARGHLRMLAGVLGVDPAPLLASYDESLASAPVSPRQVFDAELSRGVVRPTGRGSRWGALVVAVLILLLVWGIARIFGGDDGSSATPGAGSVVWTSADPAPSSSRDGILGAAHGHLPDGSAGHPRLRP